MKPVSQILRLKCIKFKSISAAERQLVPAGRRQSSLRSWTVPPHHWETDGSIDRRTAFHQSSETDTMWRSTLAALPIRQQIMYKLCTIVYKCVHGAAPSYLAEMCIPVAASIGRRFLHSASHGDLMVSWARTSTYGQRSFAVSGPSVWNDLLRSSSTTLGQFQNKLKTVLFCLAYALVTV